MDLFDDFLPEVPAARARQGGKFIPKAKRKQLPRKEICASEHATSCDEKNDEHFVSSSKSTDPVGLLQVECNNSVGSDKEFVKSNHHSPVEIPNSDYAVNPESGSFSEVNLNHDGAILLDSLPSTILSSKVNDDWDSNFSKLANEVDLEGHCVSSVANTACTVNRSDEEPSKSQEVLILDGNKNVEFLDSSLQADQGVGSKNASNYKAAMSVGNSSNSSIAREVEVDSMELELDPFVDILPEAGARNASKFQPKIKPRPRVGTAAAGASASPDVTMEKFVKLPTSWIDKVQSFQSCSISSDQPTKPTDNFSYTCSSTPLSEDSRSLEETIPSQSIPPNAMPSEIPIQNNVKDWPSGFGKSSGETTDIFSGLECLDDFLTQAGTGTDQTFGTTLREEQTNAADSPTFGDLLHVDGENIDVSEIEKDATMPSSPTNHKGGEPLRQLRKRGNRKIVDETEDEDVDSDDDLDPSYNCNIGDLEENDDAIGVDCSSKKKGGSTSSKKKTVAKNGKQSQKRKKANEDSKKSSKEPAKKFSHSTQRRSCVDKALLEIPEDELDPRTLRIKDIILLAEYRERLAKKEAGTLKTPANDQSGGDSLHETDTHDEEEILGSEDGRGSDNDQAREREPAVPSLFNYQSFMEKTPNGKWSKQDTELFYEAVRQFGTDFSMIQQLFPGRTRHQVKLKYKKEERQHPLRLSEAVNTRANDHSHFKSVIERLQQASTKAEEDDIGDGSVGITSVEDLMHDTDEEVARSEQETVVKDKEDVAHSPQKSDDSDNDLDMWCQYKSDY